MSICPYFTSAQLTLPAASWYWEVWEEPSGITKLGWVHHPVNEKNIIKKKIGKCYIQKWFASPLKYLSLYLCPLFLYLMLSRNAFCTCGFFAAVQSISSSVCDSLLSTGMLKGCYLQNNIYLENYHIVGFDLLHCCCFLFVIEYTRKV